MRAHTTRQSAINAARNLAIAALAIDKDTLGIMFSRRTIKRNHQANRLFT